MTDVRLYLFEGIDEALDLVPLVARRALDAAGAKVSLESWRKAPLAARRTIATLGAVPRVDSRAVRAAIEAAHIPSSTVPAVKEPTPRLVPSAVSPFVSSASWQALAPLDRYALWKVARGKHPDDVLPRVCAELLPLSSHVTPRGEAHMVDVGGKGVTARRAIARGRVTMDRATAARLRAGDVAKGDVLATARIAGIQAAKRTPELIPLCHAIALTRVEVDLTVDVRGVGIEVTAEALDRTGVEMEALTAASVAALTIYDMLKSSDRGMRITVALSEKSGGKSGVWLRK